VGTIFELVLYILSLGGILVIITLVALKNIHSRLNQYFIIFSLCVFTAVGLSNIAEFSHSANDTIWLIRVALFFGDILTMYFYRFTLAFTGWKPNIKRFPQAVNTLAPILAVTALFPETMKSVNILKPSGFVTNVGPLLYVNLLFVVAVLVTSFTVLFLQARKSDNRVKLQVRIMIYGVGGALGVILFAQVFLPAIHIYNLRSIVSAPAGLIFTASMAFAVFRQRMFDIRAAVLRSIGYILTILAIVGLYVVAILGVSRGAFPNLRLNTQQEAYFVIATIVLALSFNRISSAIRKATNKIFYQDRYDAQEVLNQTGKVLSSEIQISVLGKQIASILDENLNTRSDIVVLDNNKIYYESGGYLTKDLEGAATDLEKLGTNTLVADNLPASEQLNILKKYGIAVFAILRTRDEKTGYLLFSQRNNKETYTNNEVSLIETIAEELSVGFQNSRSFSVVQQFNESLQTKVDKATRELRVANLKLKKDDAVKDDFISMASHQLITPLSAIDGYLALATQGVYGKLDEKLSSSLVSASERAEVMKGLLNDLLDLGRMTAGKFMLQTAPTDINKVVFSEVKALQPVAKDKDAILTFHEPKLRIPDVTIDAQKTGQAVMNLVHNALQYTPGGKVDVYLTKDNKDVVVKVVDNGIGVPEEQKAKLFTKFYRADNARKERPSGTGIGLYLVKRVVEDQGGSIIFNSVAKKGSTFGFKLPLKGAISSPTVKTQAVAGKTA
jgi:signal transduction histidine kinase